MTTDPLAGIRDGVLRGIAHALSNRVAALSGVAGLVDFGDLSAERLSRALGAEVAQLGALVELVRLVPADSRQRAEALELQAVLPQIVALHAMHPDLRDIPCTLAHDGRAAPVHLKRSALVYATLLLLDAAKRDAASNGSVAVGYGGDPVSVTIVVESRRGPDPAGATDDATALRERISAVLSQLDPVLAAEVGPVTEGESRGVRIALRLPTLAEVRRRERADAGEGADAPPRPAR